MGRQRRRGNEGKLPRGGDVSRGHVLEDEENLKSKGQHRSQNLGAGKSLGACRSVPASWVRGWRHEPENPHLWGLILGTSPPWAGWMLLRVSTAMALLSPAGRRNLTFVHWNSSVGFFFFFKWCALHSLSLRSPP